jgi:hypothetical protein
MYLGSISCRNPRWAVLVRQRVGLVCNLGMHWPSNSIPRVYLSQFGPRFQGGSPQNGWTLSVKPSSSSCAARGNMQVRKIMSPRSRQKRRNGPIRGLERAFEGTESIIAIRFSSSCLNCALGVCEDHVWPARWRQRTHDSGSSCSLIQSSIPPFPPCPSLHRLMPYPDASRGQQEGYHFLNFIVLGAGLVAWLRVLMQWLVCLRRTSPVIRSYFYIFALDGLLLVVYLPFTAAGLMGRSPCGSYTTTTCPQGSP